jgi:hypothetical protein
MTVLLEGAMIPGVHFCWRLSKPHGHSMAGRNRQIEKKKTVALSGVQPMNLLLQPILPCGPITKYYGQVENKCSFTERGILEFSQNSVTHYIL